MTIALTAGELTSLRDRAASQRTTWYLTIIPQAVVATAQVNQSTFTRPLAQLTVDNTSAGWGNVHKNMSVWLGTTGGANDVGIFRVRQTPTADTLYIQELSNGDFGLKPTGTLKSLGDNLHVTVINDFNLWSVFSRIVYLNDVGTFFKDYDIAYDDQNKDKPPPILNIGEHEADFVDESTGVLTISRTATVLPWLSETVVSYSWDIDDGSFTVGNSSAPSWTATFPPGHRVISCTVVLSSGATITAQRHINAHDDATYPPIEIRSISSSSLIRTGRRASLDLFDPITDYELPNNAMVILWSKPTWGSTDIPSASHKFVGFAKQASAGIAAVRGGADLTTRIEVASPLEILKETVSYSQQLVVSADPVKWTEFVPALAKVDFVVFYLLYWHSTLLNLFDFEPSGLTKTAPAWKVSSTNFVAQLNEVTARISGWVGQTSRGTIQIKRDPMRLNTSERNALIERMTLTPEDGKAAEVPSFHHRPPVGRVRVNGLVSSLNQSVVHSFSPGRVGAQGHQEVSLLNLLPDSQADINRIAADEFARLSNPYGRIIFNCLGNYNVFEPAEGYWVPVDIPAEQSPTGEAIQMRCAVVEVSITHDRNGVDMTTLTLEGEASGINAPGETIIIPRGDGAPSYDANGLISYSYDSDLPWSWDDGWFEEIYQPQSEETQGSIIAYSNSAVALSVSRVDTAWYALFTVDDPGDHILKDFILDPDSPRLTTDPKGTLGGFVLEYDSVAEETILKYTDDLLVPSPIFTDKQTITGILDFFRPVRGTRGVLAFGSQQGTPDYYLGAPVSNVVMTDPTGTGGWIGDGVLIPAGPDGKLYGVVWTLTETNAASASIRIRASLSGGDPPYTQLWGDTSGNDNDGTYIYAESAVNTALNPGGWTWYDELGSGPLPATGDRWAGWRHGFNVMGTTTFSNIRPIYYGDPGAGGVLIYTDDQGDNILTATFGDGSGPAVGDCDDFDGGAVIAAAGAAFEYATTYGGSFSTATGFNAGSTVFSCIRIPYRRFSDPTSVNNDGNALEFVACFHAADGGKTIQWGEINLATGAVTHLNDISPVISSVTYAVIDGANNLETFASNPHVMRCLARDESDELAPIKLLSRDKNGTWTIVQDDIDFIFLHHTGLSSVWLTGQNGVVFSSDGGSTLQNRDGDFTLAISNFPVIGMRLFI